MDVYLARQPIFDSHYNVVGYELLYRDTGRTDRARFPDGNTATRRLLSDAATEFGLSKLTNSKPAYINFTESLLLEDFARLANPREVVIEVLEDVRVTEKLIHKLKELKRAGYRLALDDYVGQEQFHRILPLMDVLKVDFRDTGWEKQHQIAMEASKYKNMTLLAEKVETEEEFVWAASLGYKLFQGYFFAKPVMLRKKRGAVAVSSYVRLLAELNRPDGANFDVCAKIIYSDAALSYGALKKVQRLSYYRGNLVTAITQALVMMGADEVRRWALLVMARDNNMTYSDELVRQAYLRGAFAQRLMQKGPQRADAEYGFIVGMFSLLDKILDVSMEEVLQDIRLPPEIAQALLGEADNYYSRLLQFIMVYESGNRNLLTPDIGVTLTDLEISELYVESIVETDNTFNGMEGNRWEEKRVIGSGSASC
jgi:EAL and modified HD-GYP domain-containing signal transduction protein